VSVVCCQVEVSATG